MAIQVRCDFTPGEFDYVRKALQELADSFDEAVEDDTLSPKERHEARADLLRIRDLLAKLV